MFDAILIDDDPWVRSEWQTVGQKHARKFLVVESFSDIEAMLSELPKDVPIFIDFELGSSQNGIEIAELLHKRGMTCLYLATAHDFIDLSDVPFMRGKIDKNPPFWILLSQRASTKLSNDERRKLINSMDLEQKRIFDQRIVDYENALYGLDGSTWLDGVGSYYPDAVLDAWERGLYESLSDKELKLRIQQAWRESDL